MGLAHPSTIRAGLLDGLFVAAFQMQMAPIPIGCLKSKLKMVHSISSSNIDFELKAFAELGRQLSSVRPFS